MSRADTNQNVPRAMIHRRILDVAETNPDATLESIADEVSGASPLLVERVLDEYGDPADTAGSGSPTADGSDGETADAETVDEETADDEIADDESADSETADDEAVDDETADDETGDDQTGDDRTDGEATDGDDSDAQHVTPMNASTNGQQTTNGSTAMADPEITLSDKQRRTLRTVYDHPEASQGDVAEALGVTRPTVSRRLNSIPGFEWSDRCSFARSVFESEAASESTRDRPDDAESDPDSDDSSIPTESTTSSESVRSDESGDGLDDENDAGVVDESEIREALSDLDRRLSTLESDDASEAESATSEADESDPDTATMTLSPELAHKVVHACLNSDRVSEDEEMELLRSLMHG